MKTLITCHANADYDAFAAMLAARHIYKSADLLFPGTQESSVAKIFSTISRERYNFIESGDLNWDEYDRLVIVDTRQASRCSHVAPLLERGIPAEIWDHHPAASDDLPGATIHYGSCGAVTSLLCSELQRTGLKLDAEEATLLGLGIYGDTGSFTYSSTTPADFQAASWLLGQGMDVVAINDMASHELTSMHVQALNSLLESARVYDINDVKVVLADVSMEHYLGDFANLAHKLMEMEKFSVLFAIGVMGDRIQVVARSHSSAINVGLVCAQLGGGGHNYAASASLRFKSLHEVRETILRKLHEQIHPEKTARDYMSAPAIGIDSTATIRAADELMLHFGLKAIPVFQPGTRRCAGLLDAQTAARANAHGLGEEAVLEYMQRRVITLGPNALVRDLADAIIGGRQRLVPIVENERVTGVVTRTDLINLFASECVSIGAVKIQNSRPYNICKLLRDRLDAESQRILKIAGKLGKSMRLPVYAVGGFVRDVMIGMPTQDIDLVAEGNGIAFARELAKELGGRVREHQKFLTAVVIYHDPAGAERHIDVATARLEYYEYPAALPTVELSSLKMDLFRRDFSINALAIRLDGEFYGNVEDFFGGRRDIKDKLIRVIHTLSFVEDPTRCIRAVRFEQRYRYRIGPGTEKLIKNILPKRLLEKLSPDRLFNEIRHLCNEENGAACFERLDNLGILKALNPLLVLTPNRRSALKRVQEILAWRRLLFLEKKIDAWICYYYALTRALSYSDASAAYTALGLPASQKTEVMQQREKLRGMKGQLLEWQAKDEKGVGRISELCRLLKDLAPESLLYAMAIFENEGLEKNISRYITQWQREKPDINGHDLQNAGIRPGPIYGEILRAVLAAKLDGLAPNPKSQITLALDYFRKQTRIPLAGNQEIG